MQTDTCKSGYYMACMKNHLLFYFQNLKLRQ
jgi:hypothetical protein